MQKYLEKYSLISKNRKSIVWRSKSKLEFYFHTVISKSVRVREVIKSLKFYFFKSFYYYPLTMYIILQCLDITNEIYIRKFNFPVTDILIQLQKGDLTSLKRSKAFKNTPDNLGTLTLHYFSFHSIYINFFRLY